MRSSQPLTFAVLAGLVAFLLTGAAQAGEKVRPAEAPVNVRTLRSLADHYRVVTWTYQRAAHVRRTPSSLSYRRSSDPAYLQWTIDTWTRRAYVARSRAVAAIERRLSVDLPVAPRLHARLLDRVRYSRQLTLRLRRIYPGTVTRAYASARAATGRATLRLWQARSAAGALAVARYGKKAEPARPALPDFLQAGLLCIHS